MSLAPGTRLGSFEVTGTLGAGGMGEVYRARDTRLDREVAIKVLPASFAGDRDPSAGSGSPRAQSRGDRLMRFEREAKTLAALNHPHIAHVYGLEPWGDTWALVMELVEGEDLAARIARGPVPLDEALPIARQIADALEAAHDAGIVHRDLKPANVRLRPDGTVKVLDFGLAKALHRDPTTPGAQDLEHSPTITSPAMTMQGVILGTAAYMAPEQAKGRPLDRRADVWAFGCVLYEMLTGRRAFDGEDVTDTIAALVGREPDWSRLPAGVPASVERLLRRCLEKPVNRRLPHIGVARMEIEEAGETPKLSEPPANARRWPGYLPWAIAALATAAALVMALGTAPSGSTAAPVLRLDITTPPIMSHTQIANFALSPDGRFIAFVAGSQDAPIFLRTLETGEVRPLPGTGGAQQPFWSPDSRSIAYFAGGSLLRAELAGSAPTVIARNVGVSVGGTWNQDGAILFGIFGASPLLRVAAMGGAPVPLNGLAAEGTFNAYPNFLPDGDRFLFASVAPDESGELRIGALSTGTSQRLMPVSSPYARFLAPDRVVYLHEGELRAQRIDVQQASLVGTPETLATGVPEDSAAQGAFSVSSAGRLAYRAGGVATELAWFDRTGRMLARAAQPDGAHVVGARVSPDGTRIALDRNTQGNRDVWVLDAARGSLTRLTSDPTAEGLPVWSPDGQRLAYESLRSGVWNLHVRPAAGQATEERLQESSKHQIPLDWSRDGRFLLYLEGTTVAIYDGDLFALPMTGADRTPLPIATTPFTELSGRFSPDGRWVVYETHQSGRPEIVVQPFPDASAGAVQVSVQGGSTPRWSADGRELYFMARDGTLMAADVTVSGARFEAGVPRPLFRSTALNWFGWFQYDVDRTGRFLMSVATDATPPIRLLLNWKPAA
jgi:serine/threonine protein kinase/Tol biopolymer transport system component